ncbi:MAG: Acid-resistant locus arl7 [Nevskia sp.]|nr:Acid-resistant locus arl7 [Nevskia sp.]
MTGHIQLFSKVPLFEGLSDDDLAALFACLTEKRLHAGELLFSKGDAGTSMFVVLQGSVRIFLPPADSADRATVLRELGPGEYFGEMALLDNQPRMASVDALSDATLGELAHERFIQQLRGSPQVMTTMLRVMSQRLRTTTTLLEGRAARNINLEADEKLTWAQRLADRVAQWNGSWLFIVLLLGVTLIWIAINAFAPLRFDAYPYQFFNLFLAILVSLQGPLIMMSQNRQVSKERLHSEADYLVNLKNETGIEKMLEEVRQLRAEVAAIKHAVASGTAPGA